MAGLFGPPPLQNSGLFAAVSPQRMLSVSAAEADATYSAPPRLWSWELAESCDAPLAAKAQNETVAEPPPTQRAPP